MSARLRGDRLSSDDAARLHMESAGSPMTISIVILLAGELSLDTVVQRVEERLLGEPRLRARVHDRVLGPTWEPQDVDVRAHVRAAHLLSLIHI